MPYTEPTTGAFTPPPGSANYTPDYMALIQQDPAFMALSQMLSAQGTQNAAQRQSATQQALIQFGAVPDFTSVASQLGLSPEALQMLQADIDPNAAALASQNTQAGLSTEAQLQQGQHQAIMSLRNALAARGALGSGENAYRTNLQDQSYARQQNDALQSLLQSIGGYQNQYLSAQQQAEQRRQEGLQQALQFESSLPQNQGFHLTYNVHKGVYMDASGNTYTPKQNADGTWTLTNHATGGSYVLKADGTLTTAPAVTTPPVGPPPTPAPTPPSAGFVPDPTGTPPPLTSPNPPAGWTTDPANPPIHWFGPGGSGISPAVAPRPSAPPAAPPIHWFGPGGSGITPAPSSSPHWLGRGVISPSPLPKPVL